jgi:hypothetical protein
MRNGRVIEDLCLVARTDGYSQKGVLAGFTDSELPMLTIDVDDLSDQAKLDFQAFSRSGYPIPKIRGGRQIEVASIQYADQIQDLKDPSPERLIQDTVRISVLNQDGSSNELILGELELLNMIGNLMITFQRFGSVLDSADRQEAVEYFSFYLPGFDEDRNIDGDSRPDFLLLIKPTNKNVGNLIDVILFVSDVLKKLVMNDNRQMSDYRKGYQSIQDSVQKQLARNQSKAKGLFDFLYVPANQTSFIRDLLYVPVDGSKPRNPLLVPVASKPDLSQPSKDNLLAMKLMASKMYEMAKTRTR